MSRYQDAHTAGKAMPGDYIPVADAAYPNKLNFADSGEYRLPSLTNIIAQMDQTAEQIDGLVSRLRQITDRLQESPSAPGQTGSAGQIKSASPTTLPTLAARSETIYKLVSYGHDIVTELEKML